MKTALQSKVYNKFSKKEMRVTSQSSELPTSYLELAVK